MSLKKKQIGMMLAGGFVIITACLCIPTCDDHFFRIWEFASVKDFFLLQPCNWEEYSFAVPHNGRYLGNVLGFLLAKSYGFAWGILRIVIMTGGPVLLYVLINRLFDRKFSSLIVSLLILMPVNLYTQVIHWAAGYANYFVPMIGLLVLFCLLRVKEPKRIHYIAGMAAAFSTQLFAEHVTIYLLAVLFVCMGARIYQHQKMPNRFIACTFVAAAAGACLMFSNAGYHTVNTDEYRTFGLETVLDTARVLAYDVIVGNGVLLLLAGIGFCLLLYNGKKASFLKKSLLVTYGILTVYTLVRTVRVSFALESYRRLDFFAALAVLLLLFYFTAVLIQDYKKEALFYLCSVCFINGMLLLLSPISARCAFVSYVLLVLYGLTVAKEARLPERLNYKKLIGLFAAAAVVYGIYLTYCYTHNYKVQYQWEQYCTTQREQKARELYVPALPYPHLVYESNSLIYYIFSIYYEKPGDIYFEMWDYDRWISERGVEY